MTTIELPHTCLGPIKGSIVLVVFSTYVNFMRVQKGCYISIGPFVFKCETKDPLSQGFFLSLSLIMQGYLSSTFAITLVID